MAFSISAPDSATVILGKYTKIPGLSVADSDPLADVSVTLADARGVLSSAGDPSIGAVSVTFTGSLSTVNADLAGVVDWDSSALSDTINITAVDSDGYVATPRSVAVAVTTDPHLVPAATTADFFLRNSRNEVTEYNLGNDKLLASADLGSLANLQGILLGDFSGRADETDMLARSVSGMFYVYDTANDTITSITPLGQVGTEWRAVGAADLSGRPNETDVVMQNTGTGALEAYDISNNTVTSVTPMGTVGLEWTVAGFGDFSSRTGETDMLMRRGGDGEFQVYDIIHNAITSATVLGQVGPEWQTVGFGDFSGNSNETDMMMRSTSGANVGDMVIYNVSGNQITGVFDVGTIGLEWQPAGVGSITSPGAVDVGMYDPTTGVLLDLTIAHDAIKSSTVLETFAQNEQVVGMTAAAMSSMISGMAAMLPSAAAASGAVAGEDAGPTPAIFAHAN